MLILRIFFLLAILSGYSFYIKEKFEIAFSFSIATTISCLGSFLILSGILNILPLMIYMISIFGFALFINYIFRRKILKILSKKEKVIYASWLFLVLYLFFMVSKASLYSYDNFSHWATVVKSMLINNRFPNFEDNLVTFQAYPLASSVFIYYVLKLVGTSDSCYMLGQIILMLSFLITALEFINKKNRLFYLFAIAFFAFALSANVQIYDLLVDSLLAAAAFSLFSIGFYYGKEEKVKKVLILSIPFNIFLLNIKNSGIFFVFLFWIYLAVLLKKLKIEDRKKKKTNFVYLFINVFFSLFSLYLWKRHVNLVFVSGQTSKHAMSISNFRSILGQKSLGDILNIGKQMLISFFSFTNTSLMTMILISFIILVLAGRCFLLKDKKNGLLYVRKLFAIYLLFFIYLLAVFFMYVFSMPLYEAEQIAGFNRYILTIVIFIFGLFYLFLVKDHRLYKNKKLSLFIIMIITLSLIPIRTRLKNLIIRYEYKGKQKLEDLVERHQLPRRCKYLIYDKDMDLTYLEYMAGFEIWTDNLRAANKSNFEECLKDLSLYDYIIVLNPDDDCYKLLGKYIKNFDYLNKKEIYPLEN